MLIGSLLLGLFGLWHGDWQSLDLHSLSANAWLWLAYLVLPVSLGVYPAYFWLLREVRPSLVSTFALDGSSSPCCWVTCCWTTPQPVSHARLRHYPGRRGTDYFGRR